MISIYFHIPFCQSKCKYCSFTSFPIWENWDYVKDYIDSLYDEIECYSKLLGKQSLKTLYFWWWTPNLLWGDVIISLIEKVETCFDLTDLWELSFEFNPYPEESIYDIIKKIQSKYWKKYPRIRFSFGVQSFDNEVLQLSWRKTLFLWLVDFLRWLQPLKQDNTVFNFDFIAFWKWNKSKKWNSYLWSPAALDFFKDFVNSLFADSFSLYTLELLWNQIWKTKETDKLISWSYFWTDDEIYEEFSFLKDIIENAWYSRYEISNFSLAGKSSIHNRVYWEMWDYLGLW
jgi:oxygen-independent coproporphyrinogen-3 oxidase